MYGNQRQVGGIFFEYLSPVRPSFIEAKAFVDNRRREGNIVTAVHRHFCGRIQPPGNVAAVFEMGHHVAPEFHLLQILDGAYRKAVVGDNQVIGMYTEAHFD